MTLGSETVLVTGFPGFHARKLAFHLLRAESELRLILLRRAEDAERSSELLFELGAADRARVVELEADPAALDFGLSGVDYLRLAGSVQRVFHFASVLEGRRKTSDLAAHNLACAREVLAFAKIAGDVRGLVLLSSVKVCGTRTGVIREEELREGQSFRGCLDESLATVELMFAREPRLPSIILRPSQLVGDSRTGELEQLGFPYPWLVFIERGPKELIVPVPHRPEAPVQIVPIDFAVSAAHALSAQPGAYGKRYHLVDPAPPTLRQFLGMAALASDKRLADTFNAGAFTRGLVANPGLRLLAHSARGLRDLFAAAPYFDASQAQAALAAAGVHCPPVSSYLDRMLERARAVSAAHEVEPLGPELDDDV